MLVRLQLVPQRLAAHALARYASNRNSYSGEGIAMVRQSVIRLAVASAFMCGVASAANAKDKEPVPRPAQIQQLFDCRSIADAAARLACYDQQVAGLEAAEARRDISFADRAMVKKARRGLFGFSFPNLGGLFGDDDDEEVVKMIETKVKSVRQDRSGKYTIEMEDGAVWVQIDTTALPSQPRPGEKVVIKVASMGSYFVSVDGQRSIRMKRVS